MALIAAQGGCIVDGSFVECERRRLTKEENEQLKNGEIPESISSNPHVASQTDLDAEWTKKNDETYFGYKTHDLIDEEHKLIRDYEVKVRADGETPASASRFGGVKRRKQVENHENSLETRLSCD